MGVRQRVRECEAHGIVCKVWGRNGGTGPHILCILLCRVFGSFPFLADLVVCLCVSRCICIVVLVCISRQCTRACTVTIQTQCERYSGFGAWGPEGNGSLGSCGVRNRADVERMVAG